jgi:hypothetical protein
VKPAVVRFYFDADILGAGKLLAGIHPDITYPGDPGGVVHKRERAPCPIASPKVDDPVWIPAVTAKRWIIVTRDAHIKEHKAEIEAVRAAGARVVVLSGPDAISTWDQIEVIMRWRAIERLCDETGPFIHLATHAGLKRLAI